MDISGIAGIFAAAVVVSVVLYDWFSDKSKKAPDDEWIKVVPVWARILLLAGAVAFIAALFAASGPPSSSLWPQ